MKRDAFSHCHPAVNFIFFLGALGFGMVFQHPAYLIAGILGGGCYYFLLTGRKGLPMVAAMLPFYTVESDNQFWLNETYLRLIGILDFVSGMTDSYAVSLHQKLKGISL